MPSAFPFFVEKAQEHLDKYVSKRADGIGQMFRRNWLLGFTCFGGPAVHFQIFRRLFVDEYQWMSDETYKEMFALCQALPGPGSTKMIFAINVIRAGYVAGILSFLIWSLPGALAAYALAVGVFRISDSLPSIVYALLSGLNAATVGIIALAAVQLSRKAATDFITRVLVFMGGSAGLLYNALWYFPVLMAIGGSCTMTWDTRWFRQLLQNAKALMDRRSRPDSEEGDQPSEPVALQGVSGLHDPSNVAPFSAGGAQAMTQRIRSTEQPSQPVIEANGTGPDESPETNVLSWRFGVAVLVLFFVFFIAIMILRGTLHHQTRAFSVFANLFLAGTIIFGGGPVVIPLLREYVVAEGWVSPRNFLLGLAITQAFPGPNFNFGVYLGGLAVAGHSNAAVGALLGYIAIFSPGIVVHTGTMSLWKNLRERRWFTSALRGVNATAVGLIYTAVYRLWQQGLLSDTYTLGSSLDSDPWWVVVAATSFVGGHWFGVPAPAAIVLGGVMGLVWYGVVTK